MQPLYPDRGREQRCEYIFAKVRIHILKTIPLNYCPVAQVQIQAPHERRRIFITKIHADLVFQACISFFGVSGHLALQEG